MPEYADVPPEIVARLRAVCASLPEAYEDQPWTGARWRIRGGTFAHALTVDSPAGPTTYVNFHSSDPELDVLVNSGHPFFQGWGPGIVGMVLDDNTDWEEVREVLTESYCLLAPKKLIALVDRPE